MRINLQNLRSRRLASLAAVRRALKKLKFGPAAGADIFLTDDKEISKLHWRFLRDRRPTDVMSFPSDEGGEVIISLGTAKRQAHERGIPLRWELTLLALHGILHLSGFRDEKLEDWERMKIAEFENMVQIL